MKNLHSLWEVGDAGNEKLNCSKFDEMSDFTKQEREIVLHLSIRSIKIEV